MQSCKLHSVHSLVYINVKIPHQEPQRLLLASDCGLVQRLSSESIAGCWRCLSANQRVH